MLKFLSLPVFVLFCFSCDGNHTHSGTENGHHHPSEKIKPNLKLEATITHGAIQVARALKSSVGEAVRTTRIDLVKNPPLRQTYQNENSTVLSLAFTGNIHGERIDCGCRKNPLGGLARHQTLIDEVGAESERWGLPANKNMISLDAGDVFFKNVFDNVVEEKGETPAIYSAKSVAAARKMMKIDVQNIGELDLVFGLKTLNELIAISQMKVVSANLYRDDKRIFPPFQILERGEMKIAVIGITKEKSRKNDFFSSRNIESRDAIKEYNQVRAMLPKVDLVILLSNLGIPNTRKLVKDVATSPNLVIVSNTNRMTKEPKFEKGIPILEASSRGKYFGRADLILNGTEVGFANGGETKLSKLDAYARTYRNYLSARIRYLRQVEKAQLSELNDGEAHPKTGHEHSKKTHEHKKNPETFMANAKVLRDQMTSLADILATQSESLALQNATLGDDFIETKIAPVALDITEQASIKKLIDKREKKAPQVKKHALPKR